MSERSTTHQSRNDGKAPRSMRSVAAVTSVIGVIRSLTSLATSSASSRTQAEPSSPRATSSSPATNRNVFHAKQMVDAGDYDWSSIYSTLRTNDEAYVEVYLSSFSGARRALLASEAQAFKTQRC